MDPSLSFPMPSTAKHTKKRIKMKIIINSSESPEEQSDKSVTAHTKAHIHQRNATCSPFFLSFFGIKGQKQIDQCNPKEQ